MQVCHWSSRPRYACCVQAVISVVRSVVSAAVLAALGCVACGGNHEEEAAENAKKFYGDPHTPGTKAYEMRKAQERGIPPPPRNESPGATPTVRTPRRELLGKRASAPTVPATNCSSGRRRCRRPRATRATSLTSTGVRSGSWKPPTSASRSSSASPRRRGSRLATASSTRSRPSSTQEPTQRSNDTGSADGRCARSARDCRPKYHLSRRYSSLATSTPSGHGDNTRANVASELVVRTIRACAIEDMIRSWPWSLKSSAFEKIASSSRCARCTCVRHANAVRY